MRPKGTDEQLAARREWALALLREGKRPIDVAAGVGVSDRTIRRWRAEAGKSKRPRGPVGRPPRLKAQQLRRLRTGFLGAKLKAVEVFSDEHWKLFAS